jgi:hypothetical protein
MDSAQHDNSPSSPATFFEEVRRLLLNVHRFDIVSTTSGIDNVVALFKGNVTRTMRLSPPRPLRGEATRHLGFGLHVNSPSSRLEDEAAGRDWRNAIRAMRLTTLTPVIDEATRYDCFDPHGKRPSSRLPFSKKYIPCRVLSVHCLRVDDIENAVTFSEMLR